MSPSFHSLNNEKQFNMVQNGFENEVEAHGNGKDELFFITFENNHPGGVGAGRRNFYHNRFVIDFNVWNELLELYLKQSFESLSLSTLVVARNRKTIQFFCYHFLFSCIQMVG